MDLALFISLAVLLGLQTKNWKIVNVLAILGIAVLAGRLVVDYQFQIRVCHSEQQAIAALIRGRAEGSNLDWAIRAANSYFADLENATYDNPFTGSFYGYLNEELRESPNSNQNVETR